MAQLYPVEVRLTRKWSAPSIKHARYGGSLAAMVARGSFNTVSGTASCHYSMRECWSFPRPRSLNSCAITAKWRHGSRPPAPPQSSNRCPWNSWNPKGPSNERRSCSGSSRSSERGGRRQRHQGCNLRRRLASSECFRKFRPRPEKSDPAPQHPRNLRNRMLRPLACPHSGGDGLQSGIVSGPKEPLPLRVAVPDQRLPTTAQANRLLEPADFGHDLGFAPRPSPPH